MGLGFLQRLFLITAPQQTAPFIACKQHIPLSFSAAAPGWDFLGVSLALSWGSLQRLAVGELPAPPAMRGIESYPGLQGLLLWSRDVFALGSIHMSMDCKERILEPFLRYCAAKHFPSPHFPELWVCCLLQAVIQENVRT